MVTGLRVKCQILCCDGRGHLWLIRPLIGKLGMGKHRICLFSTAPVGSPPLVQAPAPWRGMKDNDVCLQWGQSTLPRLPQVSIKAGHSFRNWPCINQESNKSELVARCLPLLLTLNLSLYFGDELHTQLFSCPRLISCMTHNLCKDVQSSQYPCRLGDIYSFDPFIIAFDKYLYSTCHMQIMGLSTMEPPEIS